MLPRTGNSKYGRPLGEIGADRPGQTSAGLSAAEVLEYLPADLIAILASLHGAPKSLAQATIQLLPFGSRAALEEMQPALASADGPASSDGFRRLTLTDFAFAVIAEASAAQDADPQALAEESKRADRLIARLAQR